MENIKKDVWLSIHSTQCFEGSDQEEINLVTAARLYRRNGKYYITYDESEITGLVGTRTTLKIDGTTVSMIRTGTYPSEMLFAENQRHVGLYHTPNSVVGDHFDAYVAHAKHHWREWRRARDRLHGRGRS